MNKSAIILCGLACLVMGFLSAITLLSHANYMRLKVQYEDMKAEFATAGKTCYGIARAVDPSSRTISVEFTSSCSFSPEPRTLVFSVPQDAYIARESLVAEGSVYTAISPQIRSELTDIRVGDRVAVSINRSHETPTTPIILFGNPL